MKAYHVPQIKKDPCFKATILKMAIKYKGVETD